MADEADEIKEIAGFDRLIHEPARLAIMAVLSACESADFTYLLNVTGLTRGNLSAHLTKLEEGGYVAVHKGFRGKYPNTACALTATGRQAFEVYRKQYLALARHLEG
jgi:DNA-binding transcriptional ArsR family regulator